METFDYAAIDAGGKRMNGSLTAQSARDARDILRGRKLTLVSLNAAKAKAKSKGFSARKASHKDLTQATRQLAILIDASTPIEQALKVIALQFEKFAMRQVLLDVRSKVLEGAKLSQGLRAHPKTFSNLYIAMVASGETSGRVSAVLERLATDLEASQKMRRKILAAVIYPIVLTVVALSVVIILMVLVVPKVVAQFDTFGQELPGLTKAVIAISKWLQNYGFIAAILTAVLAGLIAFALRRPAIKYKWHGFVLKIPVIGRVSRNLNAARFARTIAGLIDSGTPSLIAMETARHTLRNVVMNGAVAAAALKVREGAAMSTALKQTDVFPPLVTQMVTGGEASGDIGLMFGKSADYLEEEFESATSVFLSLLEPLIIILLAGIVLMIIAAIFLPILRLNTMAF
ncbi:MAG: type II secretion system inner membrane protein GspF [Robiginitomaculum sp.]